MIKLLYYYLAAKILVKAVLGGYLFVSNSSGLPAVIFLIGLSLLAVGVFVLVRHCTGKGKPGDLTMYFAADGIGTVLNLLLAHGASMLAFGTLELAVTGSLFDIMVAVGALALLRWKKSAYLRVSRQNLSANALDEAESFQAAASAGKAS